MTLWQQGESLDPLCTGKGSHTGNGGRIAHFIVGILLIKESSYVSSIFGKIFGEMSADFTHKHC